MDTVINCILILGSNLTLMKTKLLNTFQRNIASWPEHLAALVGPSVKHMVWLLKQQSQHTYLRHLDPSARSAVLWWNCAIGLCWSGVSQHLTSSLRWFHSHCSAIRHNCLWGMMVFRLRHGVGTWVASAVTGSNPASLWHFILYSCVCILLSSVNTQECWVSQTTWSAELQDSLQWV